MAKLRGYLNIDRIVKLPVINLEAIQSMTDDQFQAVLDNLQQSVFNICEVAKFIHTVRQWRKDEPAPAMQGCETHVDDPLTDPDFKLRPRSELEIALYRKINGKEPSDPWKRGHSDNLS